MLTESATSSVEGYITPELSTHETSKKPVEQTNFICEPIPTSEVQINSLPSLSSQTVQTSGFLGDFKFLKKCPTVPDIPEGCTCVTDKQIRTIHESFKKKIFKTYLTYAH
ncbi:hypothetical protein D5R81_13960 [Parashewanella spongiae]|uniref:Uncharacterized protein n=1 Tax=Parashewanella spongiae TaxID=342950 RepID=A0A3A6TD98_9GAMM|nr:hypothetical protein [Parashewanella spongiae]MCL1079154.1 hypothetical protein [Parashewanella spongiae]RJY10758.1 hypothetical protein D5R81_13960 [Parashewanella spongiae]